MKHGFFKIGTLDHRLFHAGGLSDAGHCVRAKPVPDRDALCAGATAEGSEILIRRSLIWLVFMGIPMAFGKVRWSASICCTVEARPGCGAFSTGSSARLHRR